MLFYSPQLVSLGWRACAPDPDIRSIVMYVARQRRLDDTQALGHAVDNYISARMSMRMLAHDVDNGFYAQLQGFYVTGMQMLGTIAWQSPAVQKLLGKESFRWFSAERPNDNAPGCKSIVMDVMATLYNMAAYWSIWAKQDQDQSGEAMRRRRRACFCSADYLDRIMPLFQAHSSVLHKCVPKSFDPTLLRGYCNFMQAQAIELLANQMLHSLRDELFDEENSQLLESALRYFVESARTYQKALQAFQTPGIADVVPQNILQAAALRKHFLPLYAHYIQMSMFSVSLDKEDVTRELISTAVRSGIGEVSECQRRLNDLQKDATASRALQVFATYGGYINAICGELNEAQSRFESFASAFNIYIGDSVHGIDIAALSPEEAVLVDFRARAADFVEGRIPTVSGGPFAALLEPGVRRLAERVVERTLSVVNERVEAQQRNQRAGFDQLLEANGVGDLEAKIVLARSYGAREPGSRGPAAAPGTDLCQQVGVSRSLQERLDAAIAARDMKYDKLGPLPLRERFSMYKDRFPEFIEQLRSMIQSIHESYQAVLDLDASRRTSYGSVWANEDFQRRTREIYASAKGMCETAASGITSASNLVEEVRSNEAMHTRLIGMVQSRPSLAVEGEAMQSDSDCAKLRALWNARTEAATVLLAKAIALQTSVEGHNSSIKDLDRHVQVARERLLVDDVALDLNREGLGAMSDAQLESYAQERAARLLQPIGVNLAAAGNELIRDMGELNVELVAAYRAELARFDQAVAQYQAFESKCAARKKEVEAAIDQIVTLNGQLDQLINLDERMVKGSEFLSECRDKLGAEIESVKKYIDGYNLRSQETADRLNAAQKRN